MANITQFPRPVTESSTSQTEGLVGDSGSAPAKGPRHAVNPVDEETPLLRGNASDNGDGVSIGETANRLTPSVMAILLIGELLSHADTTLIFSAAPQIASELGSLRGIGWLATAYTIGVCSMQPLYGKLSDIFGRKHMLLFAYGVLSIGCVFCALSRTLVQMILSRALSGIGGAGVMTMASIIITDSVPRREFAQYRSYINLATTLGRSIGGPIGGLVADALGWRWLFWGRLPLFAISVALILAYLREQPSNYTAIGPEDDAETESKTPSFREKWKKVDVKGALMLTKTIVSLILLLDMIPDGVGSRSFWFLVASVFVFGQLFVFIELFGAGGAPIFDVRLLVRRNVALSYLVDYLQVFSQVGMMFSVPLYFQVTQRATSGSAGARIVPAVVANTAGALISGRMVRSTRRHSLILAGCGLLGAASYGLILARWSGDTSFAESLYIIGGGFATGIAQSASFVTMASHLGRDEMAMATGGFFLVSSLGTVTAVTITNTLLQSFFRQRLGRIPVDIPDRADFIDKITSDIDNISRLTGVLRDLVVDAFVRALKTSYVSGIAACLLSASFAALISDLAAGEL